jgi:hypothetical protein
VLADLAKKVVKRVTKAANDYLDKKGGQAGGNTSGGVVGGLHGPVPKQIFEALSKYGWNKIAIAGAIGNAVQESDLSPGISGGGAAGLWQWTPPTSLYAFAAKVKQPWQSVAVQAALLNQQVGRGGVARMNAQRSPADAAIWLMNNFERPYVPTENTARRVAGANSAFKQGYAEGGVIHGVRDRAMPIIAHAGEWILNQAQQHKLAAKMGTSIKTLKEMLGFSGGPFSFKGGGEVDPHAAAYLGLISKTGEFTPPTLSLDTPEFDARAIDTYNKSQDRISRMLRRHKIKIAEAIKTFLDNYQKVGGDNGIFALASQAIQDFTTSQQSMVQLAAAGVRMIGQRLRHGRAQTAVEAAETDLRATGRILADYERLQAQEVTALRAIDRRIRGLGRHPERKKTSQEYEQLLGARQDLLGKLRDADSNISQNLSDQYTKAAAVLDAQVTQRLRGTESPTADLLKHIQNGTADIAGALRTFGPTISLALAQMAQQIGQTLGNPQLIQQADNAVISALQGQQKDLQDAYNDASNRARRDPRWQTVADNYLQQLQGHYDSGCSSSGATIARRYSSNRHCCSAPTIHYRFAKSSCCR